MCVLQCILYICTYINIFIVSNIYLLTPVSCDFYGQSGSKWFFELLFCFSHSESAEINGVFPLTSNESQVRKRCLGVQSMIIIAFEKKKKNELCQNVLVLKQAFWYWFKLSGLVMNHRGNILVGCWPVARGAECYQLCQDSIVY